MSEDFLSFWQNLPGQIDPVLLSIGNFEIRWYSIGYFLAFLTVLILVFWRIKKGEHVSTNVLTSVLTSSKDDELDLVKKNSPLLRKEGARGWLPKEIQNQFFDIFLIAILGLLLGARIGYGFFYDFDLILHPLELFNPFQNGSYEGIFGMSFFGGLVGICLALLIYSKIKKVSLWSWLNFLAPAVPAGYFFGRMGNFFNGELYGRVTESKIGMYFPLAGDNLLRHPSQLYEAFFEGIIIFLVLWFSRNKKSLQNKLFLLFLILYGTARFLIEFVREEQFYGIFTTGQYLSLGIMVVGVSIFLLIKIKKENT